MVNVQGKFDLGQTVMTRGVSATVCEQDVAKALYRHWMGDWGEVSTEDAESNNEALENGSRLLSSYTDSKGIKFWIITEADRSYTTCLLPEEY